MASTQNSLFKYGGKPTVTKLMVRFYDMVLSDRELRPFFKQKSFLSFIDHHVDAVSKILGEPDAKKRCQSLREVYKEIGLNDHQVLMACNYMRKVLDECGMDPTDSELILRFMNDADPSST